MTATDSQTADTGAGLELPPPATLRSRPTELVESLVEHARAEGVELVGPGGLLGDLTKKVLEAGLEAELDEHLGYAKHDPAGRDGGNSRNGTRTKTVITEVGPSKSLCPVTAIARSSRRSFASANGASEVWTSIHLYEGGANEPCDGHLESAIATLGLVEAGVPGHEHCFHRRGRDLTPPMFRVALLLCTGGDLDIRTTIFYATCRPRGRMTFVRQATS